MREIKFRAWDSRNKIIIPFEEISFKVRDENRIFLSQSINYFDFELMQYTGLKDKNGKEIYEGDIIKDNDDVKRVIIFEDGMFCFRRLNNSRDIPTKKGSEIIGNIYENPNLLK